MPKALKHVSFTCAPRLKENWSKRSLVWGEINTLLCLYSIEDDPSNAVVSAAWSLRTDGGSKGLKKKQTHIQKSWNPMGCALSDGAAPAAAGNTGTSNCRPPGEGSCGCQFLHAPPTLALRPEQVCVSCLSLTRGGRLCTPVSLRHLDPHVKQYTFPQGFLHATHNNKLYDKINLRPQKKMFLKYQVVEKLLQPNLINQ